MISKFQDFCRFASLRGGTTKQSRELILKFGLLRFASFLAMTFLAVTQSEALKKIVVGNEFFNLLILIFTIFAKSYYIKNEQARKL